MQTTLDSELIRDTNTTFLRKRASRGRRRLIDFPEKLISENERVQTPKMNEVLLLSCWKKGVTDNKKGIEDFFFFDPLSEPAGIQTPSLLIRSQMLYSVKLQALIVSKFLDCKCKE
jgi:hypothetical protein